MEFLSPSNIQKKLFKEFSGVAYELCFNLKSFCSPGNRFKKKDVIYNCFETDAPYNDREGWEGNYWGFTFVFDKSNGFLVCQLSHRMTNNRIQGWDYEGKDIEEKALNYFEYCI